MIVPKQNGEKCRNDGRKDVGRVPKITRNASYKHYGPNNGPKQICLIHNYSFDSPKRKSAEHPHISQMIFTHSSQMRGVFPAHRRVMFTCCATGVESGHKRAAMSFFNTLLPCSFARAIACSIRIIILYRFWNNVHIPGKGKPMRQLCKTAEHHIIPTVFHGLPFRRNPRFPHNRGKPGNPLCLPVFPSVEKPTENQQ